MLWCGRVSGLGGMGEQVAGLRSWGASVGAGGELGFGVRGSLLTSMLVAAH